MREPKFPSPVNSSGFIAATTIDPGRSIPASASASADASAMSAGKLSSRLPKRVIPAPAIHTSVTPPIKPEAGSVSTLSWRSRAVPCGSPLAVATQGPPARGRRIPA